ncbi:MAG: Flp pilus assembly protein CpaB [Actinomycetota bacterium]|nr:Flp pilus assembly protein CpaB [Actinomycetota bacterium]
MRLRRLARSPLVYWLTVVALALVTATTVSGLVGRAGAQAARFGQLRPVVTAAGPLEVGAVVRAGDVTVRSVPAAFLPDGALRSASAAVGRTVVVPLFRGAAVVAANLAPDGLSGIAALLPAGSRAVAVPTGVQSVPLRRGDRVDVLATFDPPPAGQDPTFPVAEAALVVDVGQEAAAVAVAPAEATRVAYALAAGRVTLSLTAAATPASPAPPRPQTTDTGRTIGASGSAPSSALPPNPGR